MGDRLWVVYHNMPECMGPAFFTRRRLHGGDVVRAADVVLLDGSAPKAGDVVFCGSCGNMLEVSELEPTDETTHVIAITSSCEKEDAE